MATRVLTINATGDPVSALTVTTSAGVGDADKIPSLDAVGRLAHTFRAKPTVRTLAITGVHLSTDQLLLVDSTAAPVAVTLCNPALADAVYIIKRISATANLVTVVPFAAETIDGDSVVTLASQWTSVSLVSDGTNWLIV